MKIAFKEIDYKSIDNLMIAWNIYDTIDIINTYTFLTQKINLKKV